MEQWRDRFIGKQGLWTDAEVRLEKKPLLRSHNLIVRADVGSDI
jgi:hypothetical protein